jgi:hypothetical protein
LAAWNEPRHHLILFPGSLGVGASRRGFFFDPSICYYPGAWSRTGQVLLKANEEALSALAGLSSLRLPVLLSV